MKATGRQLAVTRPCDIVDISFCRYNEVVD